MSATVIDVTGLDRTLTRFRRLVNPDCVELMVTWSRIIDDDNRKGVLAGLDKDGNPMRAVTYRPITLKPPKLTTQQRNLVAAKKRRGQYAGIGKHPAGVNNNLTPAEYRLLDGPPLAPRRGFSRVITNLLTRFGRTAEGIWEAVGYWNEVVNAKGRKFLHYHFDGAPLGRGRNGNLPRRDLRGIRPDGMAKARRAARAFMLSEIRSAGA